MTNDGAANGLPGLTRLQSDSPDQMRVLWSQIMTFVLLAALLGISAVGSFRCTQYLRKLSTPAIVERTATAVGLAGVMSIAAGLVTFDATNETGLGLVALGILGVGLHAGTSSVVWIAATVFEPAGV